LEMLLDERKSRLRIRKTREEIGSHLADGALLSGRVTLKHRNVKFKAPHRTCILAKKEYMHV